MTRAVSTVEMLSSPVPWDEIVESKVSFPSFDGEDGLDKPSVRISGTSSSSGMTISPSRAGVKCTSAVVGTSGRLSLSNRHLMAVAAPAVLRGGEVMDVTVCSPRESRGEPKVV